MSGPSVQIDVISDVVCPWCYIGKRRLEKALQLLGDEFSVTVHYHPFELNPDQPEQGVALRPYLVDKFGGEDTYEQVTDHVARMAAGEGLAFALDRQPTAPNTRKAHAVIALARQYGLQERVAEAYFKAYFSDAVDLSVEEQLVRVGLAAGLPERAIRETINDRKALHQVRTQQQEIYQLGVRSVPFYIINQQTGISGAQLPQTFADVIRNAVAQPQPAEGSCEINGRC